MIRVLALCEYPSLNGGEHSLLAAVRCLEPRHVTVEFAAPPRGPLADAVRRDGWPLVDWQVHGDLGERLPRADQRLRLADLLAARRPTLLHANSVSMARLAGPVAREMGVSSVGHLRDIIKLTAGARADLACHRRLLAVSAATRDWYVTAGVPAAAVEVLYNGVDLDCFRPGPPIGDLQRELRLPAPTALVGTIGQIGPRKGIDLFLAAAARVAAIHGDVQFVIVGQRYSGKSEAGRVHWLGVRTDVPQLLRELTLYVHAARQEPLGRVLLEAAASGLPIVATRVGGTEEIFPPASACAALVPPDASDELATAMNRLLGDPGLRRALGMAARRRVAAEFDVRRAADRLAAVYADAIPG